MLLSIRKWLPVLMLLCCLQQLAGAQVATYNAAATGVVKSVNGIAPDSAGNVTSARSRFDGTVISTFKTLSSFDNLGASLPATAFALGTGGGLITSSSGNTASGYRYLPRGIGSARPTRTDWLIDWDTQDTGTITVGVGLSSGTDIVSINNSGGSVVATLYTSSGTTTTFTGSLGTGRVSLSVSIATANGDLTESMSVLGTPQSLATTNPLRVPVYTLQSMPLAPIQMAYFATSCTSSRIVGWLHNASSLDGDPAGVLLTQTVCQKMTGYPSPTTGSTSVTADDSIVIIPPRSSLTTPLKTILFFHGRTGAYYDAVSIAPAATAGDYGETIRQLLYQGYAYIADSGGGGVTNQFSDWWGAPQGLEKTKALIDAYQGSITNPGKLYLFGWSMGGVCALNFARQYPGTCACADLICPVCDLEDTSSPYGVQTNSTLRISLNAAYVCWWISPVASNLNNSPATDSGTNWQRVSQPGALPDVGYRQYQATTVSSAVTNNLTVAVGSTTGIPNGSYVFFRLARVMRRCVYRSTGVPNSLQLDAPVTVAASEPVTAITLDTSGKPDPQTYDFAWFNESQTNTTWSSSTTYAVGSMVTLNTSNPALDVKPWNPNRCPEIYAGFPIRIGVAGDGTSGGNDGILPNAEMYGFGNAVNALATGTVTYYAPGGSNGSGHVSGALSASDTATFFNAH